MAVDAEENTYFENMGFSPYSTIQQQDHLHPYYHFALPSSSSPAVDFVQSLSCEFEKQRVEIDWFIQLESKRLGRSILEEQSRLQAIIMQQCESRMAQKDRELAMARNKTRNLEDLLKCVEMEAREWEKAARDGEVVVSVLNNRLMKETEKDDNDAASFCDSSKTGTGERKMVCKLCQYERSCVVLWPCAHLCCCKLCEPLLEHCPLCHTLKHSSFEAFLA